MQYLELIQQHIALALKEALEGRTKELFASKYDLPLSGERVSFLHTEILCLFKNIRWL